GAQLLGGRDQRVLAPPGHHDIRPGVDERRGDGETDALARARDDRGLLRQLPHRPVSPPHAAVSRRWPASSPTDMAFASSGSSSMPNRLRSSTPSSTWAMESMPRSASTVPGALSSRSESMPISSTRIRRGSGSPSAWTVFVLIWNSLRLSAGAAGATRRPGGEGQLPPAPPPPHPPHPSP